MDFCPFDFSAFFFVGQNIMLILKFMKIIIDGIYHGILFGLGTSLL